MKYVAYWIGITAALSLLAIVLYGGYLLVEAVQRDSSLVGIPLVILGIIAVATLGAVAEYLSDRRETGPEV